MQASNGVSSAVMAVRFELNGEPVRVDDVAPHVTLLQWLRSAGLTGTKEGCAEGECGACAVAVVASDARGRSVFEPVNSCLLPLASLAGRRVITSEGIAPAGGGLHPVQRALVDQGGSQCGYCTPGFVVSLFCEYYRPGRSAYDPEAISGNLCRCTGYRPIVAAARTLTPPSPDDPWLHVERTSAVRDTDDDLAGGTEANGRFLRPTSLRGALEALSVFPDATPIAGGTDMMVAANQRFQRWTTLVALDSVAELTRVESTSEELTLGAAVSLSRLEEHLKEGRRDGAGLDHIPLLSQLLPLFSSRLIRNRATLGGNLATGSPIGDAAPVLLALDAELTLASASGTRRVALRDFFVGYRQTALETGELIAQIHLPLPLPRRQSFYKVSKRVLDDISTVSGAFALTLDGDGRVERMRAAYGGVAATPLYAPSLGDLAFGRPWTDDTLAVLLAAVKSLGAPLSDHRGSASYRRAMTGQLLERFFAETRETPDTAAAASGRGVR